MQVIAVAIAVDGCVQVTNGTVLLHQVQELCVPLGPDGLQESDTPVSETLQIPPPRRPQVVGHISDLSGSEWHR